MSNKTLEEVRKKINELDSDIIELLVERLALSADVARAKSLDNSPLYRPDREKQIFERISTINGSRIPDRFIIPVYRELIGASLNMQGQFRVGYFGDPGSFTHAAAIKKFGGSYEFQSYKTSERVFDAVQKNEIRYGVVPIENSTEGMVNSTLDSLLAFDLNIYSEVLLPIEQSLLGYANDVAEIKKIYTHPHAHAQVKKWLEANIPLAEYIPTDSTSAGVRMVSENSNPENAAVGPFSASTVYNVPVLRKNITDYNRNFTRFIIISSEKALPSGKDKTIISFILPDTAGALYDALEPFKRYGINMTSIESRPQKSGIWSYVFFVDFDGHSDSGPSLSVLSDLRPKVSNLRVLGSYPVDNSEF